jgi:RNA polymerase sigma factor (sigma-70 family)
MSYPQSGVMQDLSPQQRQVIQDCRERAMIIARKIGAKQPAWCDRDDLECAALEGLVVGARNYSPHFGTNPWTYICHYVTGYVLHAVRDQRRRISRGDSSRREVPLSLDTPELLDVVACARPNPQDEALEEDRIRMVWELICVLPATYRQALIYRYAEGHSLAEIGRMSGISASAVGNMHRRAIQKLRVALQGTELEQECAA